MADATLTTVLHHVRRLSGAPRDTSLSDAELLHAFLAGQDQDAFAAIVRRHGPMVLSVSRRVLRHQQDAEDAFQATFLALARKAALVRSRPALASWLHGTAYRAALALKRSLDRRRTHEGQVQPRATENPSARLAWREVEAILEAEIHCLPEKYRTAFVLCYLEGHSRGDVARQLGIEVGTMSSRLDYARKQLQRRLAQRGVSLSAALAASGVAQPAGAATVPPSLLTATTRAVASGAVSAKVAGVVEGILRTTAAARLKVVTALLLTLAGIIGWAGIYAVSSPGDPPGDGNEAGPPRAAAVVAQVDRHGDPLPDGAVARLGTVRFRHGAWVYAVAFSPDGKRVASGSLDHTIRVWDPATGRELQRLTGHGDRVRTLAYTPDGKHLVSSSGWSSGPSTEVSVRLWDASSGKEIRRLLEGRPGHQEVYVGVALSPDGKMLSAGRVQDVFLVEVPSGRRLGVCKGPERAVLRSACFSPDGKRLAAVFEFAGVCLFDVATQRRLWANAEQPTKALLGAKELAFSPDGKTLAVAADVRAPMRVIDVATGKVIRMVGEKEQPAAPLCYTPDGKRLITYSWNSTSVVWDVATWKPIPGLGKLPHSLDWTLSADGRTLATASAQSVLLWDAATGNRLAGPAGLMAEVEGVAVSPDGKAVATTDRGNATLVWDLPTGKLRAALAVPESPGGAAFSADGKTVVVGSHWGTPASADAAAGALLRRYEGAPRHVDSVACTADGRLVVGTGWTGRAVYAWDAHTGKELPRVGSLPDNGGAKALAISPDGKLVATGGMDGVVRLWDVAARKEARQLVGQQGSVWGLSFSADGRRVAAVTASNSKVFHAAGADRAIRIWDVGGHELQKLQGPPNGSRCVAWSPDGRLVATGGEDDVVRVWELAGGQERLRLRGHQGAVVSLAFTPAGRLISGGFDTTALVWDLAAAARPAGAPSDEEFPKTWEELNKDASRAYRAIVAYQLAGDRAVRWLEKRLRPAVGPSDAKLAGLIRGLDGDSFATREKAREELEGLGELALPTLEKALAAGPSAEVRKQAERLVKQAKDGSPGLLREVRAVEALEGIGTPAARRLLQALAGGAAGARVTREAKSALERVVARRRG